MNHKQLAERCRQYALFTVMSEPYFDKLEPEFLSIARAAKARILGAGKKYQISENEQGFERSTVGTMLVGLQEELLDVINYAAMISLLIGADLDADYYRRKAGAYPGLDEDEETPLRKLLFHLEGQLRDVTSSVEFGAVMMNRRLAELIDLGQYTPRDGSYEEQLAAEIAATPTCPDCGQPVCELGPEDVPHAIPTTG